MLKCQWFGIGSMSRHFTGLSDSDLPSSDMGPRRHRHGRTLSPDKDVIGTTDLGDSDLESVVSITSSAFSTQSERPRGSRGFRYVSIHLQVNLKTYFNSDHNRFVNNYCRRVKFTSNS